ncbi:MAG: hypothetical protein WC809_06900 [Sinimarinibacterium sp.]|jgi:hypothetical protein
MDLLIGLVMALAVGLSASWFGLDRDRALYPVVMIVIASYYGLFALIGASTQVLVIELLVGGVFLVASIAGFKSSLWIVVGALAAHGIFDAVHPGLYANPGVPAWWPRFCLAYDVAAAFYLAVLLMRARIRSAAR